MRYVKLKGTYIQVFLLLSILVTFLPNGLIYASGMAAQIVRAMYWVQLIIYSVTILLCLKKGMGLITKPIVGFLVWGAILLLVTIIYTSDLMKVFRATVYLLGIFTILLTVTYMFVYQSEIMFSTIYRTFTVFSFFNLATVILAPNGLFSYGWQGASYWFGGKFVTFYTYYIWLCLYSIKKRERNIITFALLLVVGLLMCMRINCSTGIACVCVTLLLILGKKIIVKIKPWMLMVIVLGITTIMVFSNVLFNSPMIQYFVVNVLHRSSLMTGRVEIYNVFLKIMRTNIWLGVGYDNTIVMQNTTLGYLNAQNGILDVITQTGLIGLAPFVYTIYAFLSNGYTYFNNIENQLAAIFLMGFFFCSFGEISFNAYFFFVLALVSGDLSKVAGKTIGLRVILNSKSSRK